MNKNRYFTLIAFGILLTSGSNLVSRFSFPMNDFVLGCLNGLGIGIMIMTFIRMRKYNLSCKQ